MEHLINVQIYKGKSHSDYKNMACHCLNYIVVNAINFSKSLIILGMDLMGFYNDLKCKVRSGHFPCISPLDAGLDLMAPFNSSQRFCMRSIQ